MSAQRSAFLVLVLSLVGWSNGNAQPTPIRAYELNNSLTDTYSGPSLVNNGGTLGTTGLTFAANQGPTLSSWLGGTATAGNYSMELFFTLDNTSSYRKFVDFKDRVADAGLYNLNSTLNFYPVTSGSSGAFTVGSMTHVVITRSDATNDLVGYINGSSALGISFTDSGLLATFTGTNEVIHFFRDDFSTSQGEASGGFVDFIRIYDRPLTAGEAQQLFAAIPEPGTIVLTTLACTGLAGYMWHRRRTNKSNRSKRSK